MINLLSAITWIMSKKNYLATYAEDDSAKKAATKLWDSISNGDIILFVMMLVITISLCFIYFFPFNEKPGRHYHPKWWVCFYIATLILVFVSSLAVCWWCIAKNPGFDIWFLMKVSAINMLYALLLYFAMSFVFIKSGKSNAYPWI